MFIERGHAFRDDGNQAQMYGLSLRLVTSAHFLGSGFSWGDDQILLCSRRVVLGSTTLWVAIDTNHHLTFVVQEVEEFERGVAAEMFR
jgi:hypothetical protein